MDRYPQLIFALALSALMCTSAMSQPTASNNNAGQNNIPNTMDSFYGLTTEKLSAGMPAGRITKVRLGSLAARSGLRTGDQVVSAVLTANTLKILIQRGSNRYEADLPTRSGAIETTAPSNVTTPQPQTNTPSHLPFADEKAQIKREAEANIDLIDRTLSSEIDKITADAQSDVASLQPKIDVRARHSVIQVDDPDYPKKVAEINEARDAKISKLKVEAEQHKQLIRAECERRCKGFEEGPRK